MIHIACAADEGFMPHCAVMLHSLIEVHTRVPLSIHFLHDDQLSSESLSAMADMVRAKGKQFHPCLIDEATRQRFPGNRLYGQVAWYRILLPDLLPDLDRVLYLDADTIILQDIEPLWRTELGHRPLAAVANPLYAFMDTAFLAELSVESIADYFNSGVLLMNLTAWRERGIMDEILTFAAEDGARQTWPDQNALNKVLRGQWLKLPPKWNAQNTLFDLPETELPFAADELWEARQQPAILHFIGPYKPWHYRSKHRLGGLYWKHLCQTPWAGRKMDGVSMTNRLLKLLPEQMGWKLEVFLKELYRTIIKR